MGVYDDDYFEDECLEYEDILSIFLKTNDPAAGKSSAISRQSEELLSQGLIKCRKCNAKMKVETAATHWCKKISEL